MDDFSTPRLGQVIRSLREKAGMTQVELGTAAGYKKGAGVAISRIERGFGYPSAERLVGITRALELSVAELTELIRGANEDRGEDTSSGVQHVRKSKELRDHAARVQARIDERTSRIFQLGDSFNAQHDRAQKEFFNRLIAMTAIVEGPPHFQPTDLGDDEDTGVESIAAFRLRSTTNQVRRLLAGGAVGAAAGAAVGSATAYGTFVAVASFGTASTGAAISGLSGAAATNATFALLGGGTLAAGGAGVTGGTMLLAGLVAAPTAILLAGGLLLMRKRNQKQQRELAEQLDQTEEHLANTEAGFQALLQILPRATSALDYIATHGGHALERWTAQVGTEPRTWESLSDQDQQRYQDFADIAAAQVTIVTINVQGIMNTSGDNRDELIRFADEVLIQSLTTVKALI